VQHSRKDLPRISRISRIESAINNPKVSAIGNPQSTEAPASFREIRGQDFFEFVTIRGGDPKVGTHGVKSENLPISNPNMI
jgi:hypothetical protein